MSKSFRGGGVFLRRFFRRGGSGGAEEAKRTDYTKLGLIWKISEKCGEKGMVPDFFADSKNFDRPRQPSSRPASASRPADSKLKH